MSESVRDRLKEAREATYREAVLAGAERVFADHGFAGAKMADVAAAAGVSLGTLYSVFEGKEHVHQAVHEWRAQEILAYTTDGVAEVEDLLDAILHGTRRYTRFQLAHPDYLRLTLREAPSWTSQASMALPEQLDAWSQGLALAEQVFEGAIDAGVVVDERPQQHAKMMIAILQVVLADWVDTGMTTSHDEVIRRLDHAIVRAFATDDARQRWLARHQERP
ncbi:MAG: TetR/AcrR family transcriptional regulator [Alphaproteobacteria bacterium]|nr:TetR/AcrR family transcriptional regulator [Alphaproteobacteria bacterium]